MKPSLLAFASLLVAGCESRITRAATGRRPANLDPMLEKLQTMTARFAPVDLTADLSALPANERQALAKMVEAARVFDALFLRQVWEGNEPMLTALAADETPLGRARLHYFLLNKGPWSRLDDDEPFVDGAPPKPPQANFYPAGATQGRGRGLDRRPERGGEGARHRLLHHHPARTPTGGSRPCPTASSTRASWRTWRRLLREAAALTAQPTLKRYLETRAAALLSNDYYESDVAWMELDATIEPTIGPYEVYEDEWFNYKAAFESFIGVRDEAETQKLARFGAELQEHRGQPAHRPEVPQPEAGRAGAHPRRQQRLLVGRRQPRRADRGLQPAQRRARGRGEGLQARHAEERPGGQVPDGAPADREGGAAGVDAQAKVSFDAFFTHILMHELMHGLGPHNITVGGAATTVRQELKELYSATEEAKADVSGLFALQFLVDRGELDAALGETMYATYLASMFRSIRFGINEAHGRGVAVQLNYFLDHGGVTVGADGTFAVDTAKIKQNVIDLTRDLMTMQATGDYAGAKALVEKLAVIRPPVQAVLDRLKDVPVDIEPRFVTAQQLEASH